MTNQQGAPEALTDPSPDQLRAIARTARNSSGSASDDCGPLAYVLHGWRAAAIAFRAQQAALVEAQQPATHVQQSAEIEHVAGDVSKNRPESNMAQQPVPSAAEAPLPLLVRDIAADLGTTPIQVCTALAQLGFGGHSVNMAVTPHMAQSLRAHFASPTPQADSQPAATVIKKGADRQWMSERLGHLPDGIYSLYLALPAQAADSVLEDAERLERERICAAIKAEDDYCVDHGDYMLDSDDCIKIVRGEWVRPDFSVAAARKKGAKID